MQVVGRSIPGGTGGENPVGKPGYPEHVLIIELISSVTDVY